MATKGRKDVWECSVSWAWLLRFVREREEELTGLSTQGVVTNIVIPETQDTKIRYVDLLDQKYVSTPTYFVSHVWGRPFLELIESIKLYITAEETDEESQDIFLWIDIFAVNQHRNGEQASDLQGLHQAIRESKIATLLCMDSSGSLLTRVWCLYEIWHTFSIAKDRLVIILNGADLTHLRQIFITCDVSKAQATVLEDRDRILADIKNSVSFEVMNSSIRKALVTSAKHGLLKARKNADDNKLLSALNMYAAALSLVGKYDKSITFYKEYLAKFEELHGSLNAEFILTINRLTLVYKDMGKYQEALDNQNRVFEILPQKDTYYMVSIGNLALILQHLGRYEEALELHQEAYDLAIQFWGEVPATGQFLSNLATILQDMGQYQEALPLLEKSLQLVQDVYGEDHSDILPTLSNLAYLHSCLGNKEASREHYQRALIIAKNIYGDEHPMVAILLRDYGLFLHGVESYEEALPISKKAYEMSVKFYGLENANTATAANNLGLVYSSLEEYEKAIEMYQQALETNLKVFGPEDENRATVLHNMAVLLQDTGKKEESLAIYRELLELEEKLFGAEHIKLVLLKFNLSILLKNMKKVNEAIELAESALKVQMKATGAEHSLVKKLQIFLEDIRKNKE